MRRAMALAIVAALGCAPAKGPARATDASAPPPTSGRSSGSRITDIPPWLSLSASQRRAWQAVMDDADRFLAPTRASMIEAMEAAAGAARRCRPSTPYFDFALDRVVADGESIRPQVLDAVDRAHAILTPEQRRLVRDRLLADTEPKAKKKRRSRSEARMDQLREELDLSWRQMATLVFRVLRLQSDYEGRAEPWRDHYRSALHAFAKPGFRARDEPFARVPFVELGAEFSRRLLAQVIPLLTEPQCQALGRYLGERAAGMADGPPESGEPSDDERDPGPDDRE